MNPKPFRIRTTFITVAIIWALAVAWLEWQGYSRAAIYIAAITAIVVWCWNHIQGQRFQKSIESLDNPLSTIPTAPGLWGELFYSLYRRARAWQLQLGQAQNQQERFMQAIQASPNAFVMLDDGGRVEWVNVAAQALLGLDPKRDIGQNLAYLLRTPSVHALLDSQRLREPMNLRINDKFIKVQAFPYGEAQTLLLGQDLTELERTDRVRRDFVANVSHELRTPLTVLTGYNELLQDYFSNTLHTLPEGVVDALQHIAQHTQRMNTLTQDLLQLASLDASDELSAHEHQSISVAQWFARVKQATTPLAQHLSIQFENPPPLLTVQGNPTELDSALSNLVSNAIRYTQAGGAVNIYCQQLDNQLMIAVKDSGCGIAPQHLPRLTERFYRVSASRSRDSGGTGLGLAIVKHIMLRHKGELRIDSELNKGSTFSLILPC